MRKKTVYINADDVQKAKEAELSEADKEEIETFTEKAVSNSGQRSMLSREKERKFLKYEFTEEEKKAISEELARAVNEKDAVENELKSIKSQFDSRKKLADEAISRCAKQISSGYEYRDIDCEIVKDFTHGTVTVWRLDTDEIVETRRMTGADRQMRIIDNSVEEY